MTIWISVLALLVLFISSHLYAHSRPKSIWGALLALYYKKIQLIGEKPQDNGIATIVVANHPNAFIDPFALEVALGKPLLRTVRADWTQHWLVKWFIYFIGAVPLAQLKQRNQSQNRQSFRQLFSALNKGKWVVVFPEGVSHNRSRLKPFKKGTAHIAKQFLHETGKPIRIIEVALYYSDKSRLNSNIWVETVKQNIYQHEAQLDIANATSQWQQSIQQALPTMLRKSEAAQINWINQSLTALESSPGHLATTARKGRLNSQISQLQSCLGSTQLDLSFLERHQTGASLTLRAMADLLILLIGLPIMLYGLASHLGIACCHYLLTRRQSTAADKWASNSFVIGIPIYSLFWLILAICFGFSIALLTAISGIYALFYVRTWQGRKKSLYTAFFTWAQPSASQTVLKQAHQTLRPFSFSHRANGVKSV